MESQLEIYIEEKISKCRFDDYYSQGFEIIQGIPNAQINIQDDEVELNLGMDLVFNKGDETAIVNTHKKVVKSNLGSLYSSALKVYQKEQSELFLENYGIDVLRMYAPVDGVELTCAPLTWSAEKVFDELQDAIEANTLSLKTEGGDYVLQDEKNKYFVIDLKENVKFINSKNWPYSFEVNPSENVMMISKPVGNQQGLGVLGFCYVPYHFVYNIKYPVLVQVYEGDEIFQFPLAVVIHGNKPRNSLDASAFEVGVPELCKYKNTEVLVNTYDAKLNSLDSKISYECFGTTCEIGETKNGKLVANFPQCVNGYILARADGFEDAKFLYSTTNSGTAEIILDKLYEININLKLDESNYDKDAIINFISERGSKTVVYPQQKTVELIEGQYEVQVYIYRNSSLRLEETNYEQCMEVPKSGFSGVFGATEKKCFDITIPSQIISNALAGGGKQNYYILESELNKKVLEINARALPIPKSLEELQNNYLLFDEKDLDINFK